MNSLPANVRKHLAMLLPISMSKEMACFTFYDNHPRDGKSIDVIICTQLGELHEICNRKTLLSRLIEGMNCPKEIKIYRNQNCDLYYLVYTQNELIVLSRTEEIKILHRINNVAKYEIEDVECNGHATVKVILKDDAMPLLFDENFKSLQEKELYLNSINEHDTIPLILDLKRKLTEAQYCVKFNENKYDEYLKLCQCAAYNLYKKNANTEDILVTKHLQKLSETLKIHTKAPIVRFCNKKVVIILNISNQNSLCIENVCVILHTTSKQSLIYTTKFFEEVPQLPYWKEIKSQKIKANCEMYVVAVINHKELQNSIHCDIEFNVLLTYHKEGKQFMLPSDKVKLSTLELVDQNFNAILSENYDSRTLLLCILSTYEATKLHFRPLMDSTSILPVELFGDHLKMFNLPGLDNVLICKSSPDHVLYGVLVMHTLLTNRIMEVCLYTRFQFQIQALISAIQDVVPQRLVITPTNYEVTSLSKTLEFENIPENTKSDINLMNLCSSVLRQTIMIREYLDDCMVKMNESKNPLIRDKVGFKIDLVAQGVPKYLDFREKMLQEIQRDFSDKEECIEDVEHMIIDD